MQAIRYAQYGGPEVLELVDVPAPEPGPGQIRVVVQAAGINGIDWKIRSGAMREQIRLTLPAGSGNDAAGIVDAVGEGVDGVREGDGVFGSGRWTLAEQAVLTSWYPVPEGLSPVEAAGFPIPVETAVRILREVGVQPGQTLLVSGAAGGVGSAVVQIARERGITVIGTAGAANQDYLSSLGAIPTTYGDGLVERVRELVPSGVDAALDIAGSGVIPELIELTGDPAKVLSIADFSAPEHGAKVSSQSVDPPAAFAEAARLFSAGRFRLAVERTFPLADASAAHAAAEAGHVAGRLVVTVP